MKRFRFAAVIGSTLALSACAYGEGGTGVFLADCTTAAIQHTDGVDWEQARNVNLRIRQGDFTPGYLGLLMGKAYVLRIENGDDEEHTFRAIDFFRSVAVKQISNPQATPCNLVLISGANPAPGRSDFLITTDIFAHLIQRDMVREDQRATT